VKRKNKRKNLSSPRAEILAMSPCLSPSADHQRKPILLLLGDSHSNRLFPGLSLALRGEFEIHTWAGVGARIMFRRGNSWSGVRARLQQIAASTLRPGDVVAFSFYVNNPKQRADQDFVSDYVSFLHEWSAIVKSKGATLVVFGDPYSFLPTEDPIRCRVLPMLQPSFCFPAREDAMRSPVLVAMSAERGWLYFGLDGLFCNTESCGPFIPGTNYLAYEDTHHLAEAGSAYLAPFICSFFRDHGLFGDAR